MEGFPKVLQDNGHFNCIALLTGQIANWQRRPDVEEIKNLQKYTGLEKGHYAKVRLKQFVDDVINVQ